MEIQGDHEDRGAGVTGLVSLQEAVSSSGSPDEALPEPDGAGTLIPDFTGSRTVSKYISV